MRWGLPGTHLHQEYITRFFFRNIPPWMGLIQSKPQQNVQWCRHPLGYTASFKKLHSSWKNPLLDEKCLNLWMVGGFLRPAECFYFLPNGAFSQFMPFHKLNVFTQKFYPKTKFNHQFSICTFYKDFIKMCAILMHWASTVLGNINIYITQQ